jgi:hypothetical protein
MTNRAIRFSIALGRRKATQFPLAAAAFFGMLCIAQRASAVDAKVDYTTQIKPLLSDRCFVCHGPDKEARQAEMRLDLRDGATAELESGEGRAIVPGKPAESVLLARVSSHDVDERMPPADSNKEPLDKDQIELIRRWIGEGAEYTDHWAFVPPRRPAVPKPQDALWGSGAIDAFVLARLEAEKLKPSPEADRRTLIRRLSFDLLGLPPTPAEVDAFVADRSPEAYEKLVDRLLASKQYGERMAVYWLDVVRYADTCGYHGDNDSDHAPYRDYVIAAFNDNKRYDVFTREQLAGDLLENAGNEQKIASGFNRLNMTTREGGAQPKEYLAIYAADRVRNSNSIFLGLTMGCSQCHDHKFDPLSTRDFYSFAAFFADIQETPVGEQKPVTLLDQQQMQRDYELNEIIDKSTKEIEQLAAKLDESQAEWEKSLADPQKRAGLPADVAAILAIEPASRNAQQQEHLRNHYRAAAPLTEELRQKIDAAKQEKAALASQARKILISMTMQPRVVRVLNRGNWQDESGEIVQPAVPAHFGSLELKKDQRATRVDLANWIASPTNPLAARVMVNRLWKLMLGRGLVTTLDDFGSQGMPPTHPLLLDWLAMEFVESGWDVKHLVKLIAMSNTYRQSSDANAEALNRDPHNKLLARQGRWRLDAEFVRDNALKISGLLVPTIGGPSVRPYQPAGYLEHLNFPVRTWTADTGDNQYRRGLYTFWQRTFLHPALASFDAPSREECTVSRPISNTPLQALVLLNDPTYIEAGRELARRMIAEGGATDDERLNFGFRAALGRAALPEELKVLGELARKHRSEFAANAAEAAKIQKIGLKPVPAGVDAAELAAWTSVARTILNLHETITRN